MPPAAGAVRSGQRQPGCGRRSPPHCGRGAAARSYHRARSFRHERAEGCAENRRHSAAMSRYQTPQALRRALEDRLLALVRREGGDINRLRRQTAFDRLLCRLFREANAPWLLKGGYAMELRIQAARTTRDIDLAVRPLP